MVIAVAVLFVRRRVPYMSFAATIPALVVGSTVIATLVALYTVAELRPARYRLALCAATTFVCFTSFWDTPHFNASRLLDIVYAILFTGAPLLLGLLTRARAELSAKLAEIDRAKKHEQELLIDKALARERANLSREMHDVVSHQVSLIAVQAGALQVTAPDDATARTARTIRTLSVQTLDELRDMVGVLRASGSEAVTLTPQPGIDDVQALVANSGIDTTITTNYDGTVKPSAAVQRAIYRAVQEGLTNVAKHAPGATASLELIIDERGVSVTLINSKPTHAAERLPSDRNGLLGLRERAELLGGSLQSAALSDGGYRLSLRLPLQT
ncbi:histidine kinase [Mycolicibacterium sp. CBMA 226]|uniref:sensor histidine kinase n=1 Tax=Mycolicibacterium sp. CBMA 226 TaxID=2606611 RepID=UPI0028BD7191|nr:histidine kinase [Mycolicibacterium sp. CBMA 226]